MPQNETTNNTGDMITRALQGEAVGMRYPGVLSSSTNYLSQFLKRILSEMDIGFLSDMLFVLLKELISNASKANAKRIYFEKLNLNIENEADYKKGLSTYTDEVLGDWENFAEANIDSEYYIKISFQVVKSELIIQVTNNVEIIPQEYERIRKRIDYYRSSKNIDHAINEIRDDTEGAGLGIVLTMVLLQNSGIPPENYEIISENGLTKSILKIPKTITPSAVKQEIKEKILSEVDKLPSFPESIRILVAMTNADDASLKQIAEQIQKDPSLTAQIIRIASSAGYMQKNKNMSLLDSVKIIGLKVIRNLLMVVGAKEAMMTKYKSREFEEIWEDSNRVAFIASKLAGKPAVRETVGVTGLLHELGRIVLLSLDENIIKEIYSIANALSGNDELNNLAMIEEIAIGISHPEIGALLAAKWKFPDPIIMAIRFQQKPIFCPESYKEIVKTLYLAIRMNESWKGMDNYYSIEREITEQFGFDTVKKYESYIKNLKVEFAETK